MKYDFLRQYHDCHGRAVLIQNIAGHGSVVAAMTVMAALSSFLGLPGTTWDISSFGASNPRPKDPFSSKRGTKYWRNIKSDIWSKMHQGYVKHDRPWPPEWTFYQDLNIPTYLIPFFLEKGSLGLGLDAPKLEISQVVPGSPKNELCAAMTFCFAKTSYPDSENWLEMLCGSWQYLKKRCAAMTLTFCGTTMTLFVTRV